MTYEFLPPFPRFHVPPPFVRFMLLRKIRRIPSFFLAPGVLCRCSQRIQRRRFVGRQARVFVDEDVLRDGNRSAGAHRLLGSPWAPDEGPHAGAAAFSFLRLLSKLRFVSNL